MEALILFDVNDEITIIICRDFLFLSNLKVDQFLKSGVDHVLTVTQECLFFYGEVHTDLG